MNKTPHRHYNRILLILGLLFVMQGILFVIFDFAWFDLDLFLALSFVLMVLALVLLLLRYHHIHINSAIAEQRKYRDQLKLSETVFADESQNSQTYVWEVDKTGLLVYVSDSIFDILGYKPRELIGKKYIWELNPPSAQASIKELVQESLKNKKALSAVENPIMKKDGSTILVLTGVLPVINGNGEFTGFQGWDMNVTESKRLEDALTKSEQKFRSLFETMDEAFVLHEVVTDDTGDLINYRVLDANPAYERHSGFSVETVKGSLITDVFNVQTPPFFDKYYHVYNTGKSAHFNRYFAPLKKHFSVSIFKLNEDQFGTIFLDVTEKTELKATIEHVSYHDKLTGLFNRRYYEENIPFLSSVNELPLSVLLCDLNALKMANDAFGHQIGDKVILKAAKLLEKFAPESAMVARIGGDEFVVLMPKTRFVDAVKIMKEMKEAAATVQVEHIGLSVSFGLATLESSKQSYESVFKYAENKMYRYKLSEGVKIRRRTLKIIEEQLFKTYASEQGHAHGCRDLALKLGKHIGLNANELEVLAEVAYYHDIGKIAISKRIFTSAKPLTSLQRLEAERHVEIGYRLLSSLPEKAHLAMHALDHHENVDGSGYPRQLTGDDISIFSKIVRVCDSYDAMVNERPYKDKKSPDVALKELQEYKNSYYDAVLVDAFVAMMREQNNKETT